MRGWRRCPGAQGGGKGGEGGLQVAADQAFDQGAPAEQFRGMVEQMRGQVDMAPEDARPMMNYLIREIDALLADAQPADDGEGEG